MAGLVNEILQDLGLFGTVPQTFPDLFVWIGSVTVAATLISGLIKVFFWCCTKIGQVGK
ncbi:MAG: hypothetical protein K2O34_06945 [Acetatifactor sp.]|nr:hypothetical protein [Acetatifactor sp.]